MVTNNRNKSVLGQWTDVSDSDAYGLILDFCRYYLRGVAGSDPAPEDVAQNVVIEMMHPDFGRGYDPRICSRRAYVKGTARICCLKALAHADARKAELQIPSRGENSDTPASRAMASEFLKELKQAVPELTDKEFAVLDLVRERAERTRPRRVVHPADNVNATRCRQHLRALLTGHGPEEAGSDEATQKAIHSRHRRRKQKGRSGKRQQRGTFPYSGKEWDGV